MFVIVCYLVSFYFLNIYVVKGKNIVYVKIMIFLLYNICLIHESFEFNYVLFWILKLFTHLYIFPADYHRIRHLYNTLYLEFLNKIGKHNKHHWWAIQAK